jgi:creatinine amidohydrolase
MTWTSVAAIESPILVIPVGSFEQHGPHLPLDTDARIANALATHLVDHLDARTVLGPIITVSASGEHAGFPGTLSIGTETTARTFVELARSAEWAHGIVFVNGHGGNAEAIASAHRTMISEGRRSLFWSPTSQLGDDHHAGLTETSVMLHLDATTVNTDDLRAGNSQPIGELVESLRRSGVRGVSDNGILGDARNADAEHGRVVFERWGADLVAAVRAWLG